MESNWSKTLRPKVLDDVFGCNSLKDYIKSSYEPNQNFLLRGHYGTGKTSVALILAKQLTCTKIKSPKEDPCGECENCKAIEKGMFNRSNCLFLDGSQLGKSDVVSQINNFLVGTAMGSPRKVVILDEVQELSSSAIKSLLVTMEYPRPNIHFILTAMTGNIEKSKEIDKALISRCKETTFERLSEQELVVFTERFLKSLDLESYGWTVEELETLRKNSQNYSLIANGCDGSIRTMVQRLEQIIITKDIELNGVESVVTSEKEQGYLGFLIGLSNGTLTPKDIDDFFQRDYNETFNICYKMIADACCVCAFNRAENKSPWYTKELLKLSKSKSFKTLTEKFEILSSRSYPYLRKADYFILLSRVAFEARREK